MNDIDLNTKQLRDKVLKGMQQGKPLTGPIDVHIDVTNSCNAACITCWDHSPLLKQPRSFDWKRRYLSKEHFSRLVEELAELGSVRSVVISGMGDPLTHPDIYDYLSLVKNKGWHLTVLSNLLAADIDALCASQIDNLLVGVHGATPDAYMAFHPGWTEQQFFTLCKYLRRLHQAGIQTRHVQVINRDTAAEVVEMIPFAKQFKAQRVNFKLASLYGGTETCSITEEQRDWLICEGVPEAQKKAEKLGVNTNLGLFSEQLKAASNDLRHSTPMEEVGCFMGYVYTRITVDREVLFCCNTKIKVGSLKDDSFKTLWEGARWQAIRDDLRQGKFYPGCEVCGKFEQNKKWHQRFGGALHATLSHH